MRLIVDIAVFSSDLGSILLIERGDEPFKGCYALPGGHVEDNETAKEAAIRELHEETGLEVRIKSLRFVNYYDSPNRDPRDRVVSIAFYTTAPKDAKIKAGDDALGVHWHPISYQLIPLAFDHVTIVKDALRCFYRE